MANTIGFEPVAWSIDGGTHSGSLLRLLAYAALSGERGVIQPDDCKVTQLGAAGPQIAIGTGAVSILNEYGSVDDEIYVARARTQSLLDVDPTAGAGRHDMVIVRIYDPEFSSVNAPPAGQEPTWQYVRPEIIKGIPSGTATAEALNLGYPATELARIELPPNTTNITTAMIKDLRQIANPRTKIDQQTVTHPGDTAIGLTSASFVVWPNTASRNIAIPRWAKTVVMEHFISGVKAYAANPWGEIRARLGDAGSQYVMLTKSIGYDINPPSVANEYDRLMLMVADTLTIPDAYRGTTQAFALEGKKISGTGNLEVDVRTTISTKLTFLESVA